jgi:hypothetical protein
VSALGPVTLLTLGEQGSHVRDTSIFRAHAARYEAEFLEDMTRLGACAALPPRAARGSRLLP